MVEERARLSLGNPALFREQAYIGGLWIDGTEKVHVFNPSTRRLIGTVPDVGSDGARAAIDAAEIGFKDWSSRSATDRAAALRRWYDLVVDHSQDLARILSLEQGKPLREAMGEVVYAASFLQWFSEEARRVYGDVIPGPDTHLRIQVQREPVGIVAAITPWNFPLAMITRKAGPALAVGCSMILKPSELTPFSALALASLSEIAGLPPGVFNVVTGEAEAIGRQILEDSRVRKLTFTGSTAVGKQLAARAMATVKRVSLELGGNAPLIVFDDADLSNAVEGAIQAKFRNAGQTCVCANRILVQSGIYEEFVEALRIRISAMTVGDGLDENPDIGPLIDERAVAKVMSHVSDARARGAKLLVGGQLSQKGGNFFQATLICNLSPDALMCREETFGPVAGVIRFETEDEAFAIANDTNAGLAAYIFTRDLGISQRATEALQYGMVGVNTGLISSEVAPFGGIKESGLGREGSYHGLDDYLNLKYICTAV